MGLPHQSFFAFWVFGGLLDVITDDSPRARTGNVLPGVTKANIIVFSSEVVSYLQAYSKLLYGDLGKRLSEKNLHLLWNRYPAHTILHPTSSLFQSLLVRCFEQLPWWYRVPSTQLAAKSKSNHTNRKSATLRTASSETLILFFSSCLNRLATIVFRGVCSQSFLQNNFFGRFLVRWVGWFVDKWRTGVCGWGWNCRFQIGEPGRDCEPTVLPLSSNRALSGPSPRHPAFSARMTFLSVQQHWHPKGREPCNVWHTLQSFYKQSKKIKSESGVYP